jgi:anti-anti-sigma regulatory factor
VVTVGSDLSEEVLEQVRTTTLDGIQLDGAHSAILELTGVPFLDTRDFTELRKIVRMGGLLGARVMLVGLKPGIIMHLMAADVDVSGIEACLGLDEALQRIGARDPRG